MTQGVADNILGRFTRQIMDLLCRVTEGGADIERARFGVQIGLENPPTESRSQNTWGPYLIESRWTYNSSHRELFTITLEKCDAKHGFENFFDLAPREQDELLEILQRVYEKQVPTHGRHKMLRLYQIMKASWFGYKDYQGMDGQVNRPDVMLNLQLKPLLEFDSGYKHLAPRRCEIRNI